MANATAHVGSEVTNWGDDGISRIPAATAATYYPGGMIAIDASDNAVKCDNTAGIIFDGLNANTVRTVVNSDDTVATMLLDQSKQLKVRRPWRFGMDIAAAVAGDVGKALYARFDNEVTYSSTNSIFVGWVDQVLSATRVLVRPAWAGQAVGGTVGFDGATLTYTGSTGGNTVVVPDNLADGLSIKEGSNAYLTIVTTNSAERVLASKNISSLDSVGSMYGTGEDIAISWDGTRLNVTQAAANSEIRWGVDGAGIDQRWYGDTASAFMLWDQSADALILSGAARAFIGDTSDANQTIGLCINQGAADDAILTLKSSDVAHGMTTIAETDTYGYVSKGVAAEGGLKIIGMSEAAIGLTLFGYSGADDTTDAPTTTSLAAVHITGGFTSTTTVQPVAAAGNLLNVRNATNATTFVNEFIVKGDGELYSNQSATVGTFDDHDDAVLCADLSYALSQEYSRIVRYDGATLKELGILTENEDGSPAMYSVTKMLMLAICAVGQIGRQVQTLADHLGLPLAPNGGLLGPARADDKAG